MQFIDSSLLILFIFGFQASQREEAYEETIRDLNVRLKDVSMASV